MSLSQLYVYMGHLQILQFKTAATNSMGSMASRWAKKLLTINPLRKLLTVIYILSWFVITIISTLTIVMC